MIVVEYMIASEPGRSQFAIQYWSDHDDKWVEMTVARDTISEGRTVR
jgi:hypothetical protein